MSKLLFAAAVLLTACTATAPTPRPAPDYRAAAQTYLPLAVGTQWVYEVDYLGQKGELTIEIVRQEGDWFVDNRGGMLMIDRRGVRDRDRYLITFPLRQGSRWVSFLSPSEHETRTIVATDASVETPAGTFTGVAVVETTLKAAPDRLLKSYHYFAPQVGIVKIETFTEDARGGTPVRQTTTVLKSRRSAGETADAGSRGKITINRHPFP